MERISQIKNKMQLGDYKTVHQAVLKQVDSVSYGYVRMVIDGRRRANTTTAKLIITKAEKLISQRESL